MVHVFRQTIRAAGKWESATVPRWVAVNQSGGQSGPMSDPPPWHFTTLLDALDHWQTLIVGLSEAHLQRYLCEFDFRANTRDLSDVERATVLLAGTKGKRLLYRNPDNPAHA